MSKLFLMMKADFIKMKNTSFYWLHMFIPIIGIAIFLGYYSYSPWDGISKVDAYSQAISIVFPIMIGIVSSMVIEQEAIAGRFKEMLGSPYGKFKSLISKICMLLFSGFISIVIAIIGFWIGFQFILHQNLLPITFYAGIILIIFASQVFLYLFHIWLSLKWGSAASIGIGIFESLFSALIITNLGTGIWQWIPCGWSIRFCDYFLLKWYNPSSPLIKLPEFTEATRNSILFTIILGVALVIWFYFYEGRKMEQ